MRIPKRYGRSQIKKCPFCGKQVTTVSKEGVPVCTSHKNASLGKLVCLCGEFVYPVSGKWGLYFECPHCGNVSARKIFENNIIKDVSGQPKNIVEKKQVQWRPRVKKGSGPEEIIITSDDPDYF